MVRQPKYICIKTRTSQYRNCHVWLRLRPPRDLCCWGVCRGSKGVTVDMMCDCVCESSPCPPIYVLSCIAQKRESFRHDLMLHFELDIPVKFPTTTQRGQYKDNACPTEVHPSTKQQSFPEHSTEKPSGQPPCLEQVECPKTCPGHNSSYISRRRQAPLISRRSVVSEPGIKPRTVDSCW